MCGPGEGLPRGIRRDPRGRGRGGGHGGVLNAFYVLPPIATYVTDATSRNSICYCYGYGYGQTIIII